MMATPNSARTTQASRRARRELFWGLLAGSVAAATLAGQNSLPPASSEAASNRLHHVYLASRQRWERETNSAEAAWQFARACFDRADFATNDTQRAALAEQGIAASRRAIELQPKSAAA